MNRENVRDGEVKNAIRDWEKDRKIDKVRNGPRDTKIL